MWLRSDHPFRSDSSARHVLRYAKTAGALSRVGRCFCTASHILDALGFTGTPRSRAWNRHFCTWQNKASKPCQIPARRKGSLPSFGLKLAHAQQEK
jgi:hypothetical protein